MILILKQSLEFPGRIWTVRKSKRTFTNGRVIQFSASSTLEMFPVVVLGGGDTQWVACALGKENMASAHCNHCWRSKKDFHLGRGELWKLSSLAATAQTFREVILPAVAGRKQKPTGHNGVKHPSMFVSQYISGFLRFCTTNLVLSKTG
jgi:hypothetical protein